MSRVVQLVTTPMAGPAVGLACMAVALLAIRVGLLSPLAGFGLFTAGWIGGGLAGAIGGALRLGRGTSGTTAPGWVALLIGGLLLAAALPTLAGFRAPRIHDVSTDLQDPPRFRAAARLAANAGRDLTHPVGGPEVPDLQRRGYPELDTRQVDAPPERVFDVVVDEVAPELGWEITWSHREEGVVEAVARSAWFRFADDVAVRIRSADEGSAVDVRSTSRVGRSDLGANAARIRRFQESLAHHLDG